jgi:hypothetical protein
MLLPKNLRCAFGVLLIAFLPNLALAQSRGKAEMKVPNGLIAIDYGRPLLKGRDMLSKLSVGDYWRLGKDEVTVLTTPVPLVFGSTKIPKGNYSLWLKRLGPDQFELVFNTKATGHGMEHDATQDVGSAPMNKTALAAPVEMLKIELQPAPKGGVLAIQWGTSKLNTSFRLQE